MTSEKCVSCMKADGTILDPISKKDRYCEECWERILAHFANKVKIAESKQAYEDMKRGRKHVKPYTLEETKKTITKWLHIRDPVVIELIFAFAISEKLPGDPLWLFLIAPPGGCKTEILRALQGTDYYHLSDLTSKTFISGLVLADGKEKRKVDDLLPQLDKKVLIFKDFTTILEKGKEERREIMAQFREIYDGSFAKKFGTMDQKIEYKARFGLIAGVTPIIDKYWKVLQQLGERFLKYRWDEDDDATTRRAEVNEGRETVMRAEIREAVTGFLSNLSMKNPAFPNEILEPIIQVAKLLALLRTPVTIHSGQSDFYFDFIPTSERPTRLVKQLKKFCKALAIIRGLDVVGEDEVMVAIKLAFSTAPQDRLAILQAVEALQQSTLHGCTATAVKNMVRLPETSVRNILKQLFILELVSEVDVVDNSRGYREEARYYRLTDKILALSPPTLLERSKRVLGECTEAPS